MRIIKRKGETWAQAEKRLPEVWGKKPKPDGKIYAKDKKCCKCKAQAVAFFPVCDPDIPSHPYCQKHLDEARMNIFNEIEKLNQKPKHGQERNTIVPTAENSECRGSIGIPDMGRSPVRGADLGGTEKETKWETRHIRLPERDAPRRKLLGMLLNLPKGAENRMTCGEMEKIGIERGLLEMEEGAGAKCECGHDLVKAKMDGKIVWMHPSGGLCSRDCEVGECGCDNPEPIDNPAPSEKEMGEIQEKAMKDYEEALETTAPSICKKCGRDYQIYGQDGVCDDCAFPVKIPAPQPSVLTEDDFWDIREKAEPKDIDYNKQPYTFHSKFEKNLFRLTEQAMQEKCNAEMDALRNRIVSVLIDYGVSPIEIDRIFENRENFDLAIQDVITKYAEETEPEIIEEKDTRIRELSDERDELALGRAVLLKKNKELEQERERMREMLELARICPDCGGDIRIRNPTGKCDHLYYPECKKKKEG
ncbi:MAG: hypothetical protein PHN89_04470 [Candidatus Pacebacteria bacterium]|nr:hypothetical protein [Candidatus Paceibacterota bacterium]